MAKIDHTPLSKSILKTLLYFDIFNYPLTASEILKNLPTNHITPDLLNNELARLSNQSIIHPIHDFFSIQNNQGLGSRRIKGNELAVQSLPKAQKQALLISNFPFVRAVMASGSLSKDYMDEHSDLDFFIITKVNRLWIARMLLVLYRRIFLFNSKKHFCTNYFVDESHLEIEEKNLFTSIELATIIPLYGKENYQQLIASNSWVKNYLPNLTLRPTENVPPHRPGLMKRYLETIIDLAGANKLERLFMNLNLRRWKRLYESKFSKSDFEIAFKTKPYASKGHSNNLQKKILDLYQQKLAEFGNKMGINWNE